jgi:hypothetical protein
MKNQYFSSKIAKKLENWEAMRLGSGFQKTEDGGQMTDDGRQKTENRGRKLRR